METLTRDSRILVGGGREEIHPLFNYGILHNIFRHLDVETLKSVRETCTFWNEEANSLLQNKSKITITWYNEVGTKTKPTLPTFMKYLESVTPKNIFFRNYELYDWCLHSSEEEMTQFWLKCGQHIRNLILKGRSFQFYEQNYVQNVFYNWTPNMESLQIENVRYFNYPNYKPRSFVEKTEEVQYASVIENYFATEGENVSTLEPMKKCEILENIQPNYNFHTFSMDPTYKYPNFPLQWKEFFISYPNLKSLSVQPVFHSEGFDNIKELLTDLIAFQEQNPDKLQNLKHLDVFSLPNHRNLSWRTHFFGDDGGVGHCAVRNKHFEQAMNLNFKLESLKIYFEEVRKLSYDIVGKYIAKLSPALKSLDIAWVNEPLTIFPPLGKKISFPKLKDVSIELNALSSNNVDFLEQTPALERLTIGNLVGRATEPHIFSNTITMLPLDSLRHLHLVEDILTLDCVRKIGEWFPNLSHFGAIFDDKLLWAVHKYLCNSLEELEIKGKRITDAGITGMEAAYSEPKASSSKESEEPLVKRCKATDTDTDSTENRTYIGTSIGQMKKLRKVNIGVLYKPGIECVQLTDDSIYNGFVLLTQLTHLEFHFNEESITEEAYRNLCSRRNVMTLDTNRFYRGHGIEKTGWVRGQPCTKIKI